MAGYAEISQGFNLTGEGEPQRVQAGYASSSLLPMLGVRAVAAFVHARRRSRRNAPVVLLSHRLWLSRFGGDPSVAGRTIALDNQHTRGGRSAIRFSSLPWRTFGCRSASSMTT